MSWILTTWLIRIKQFDFRRVPILMVFVFSFFLLFFWCVEISQIKKIMFEVKGVCVLCCYLQFISLTHNWWTIISTNYFDQLCVSPLLNYLLCCHRISMKPFFIIIRPIVIVIRWIISVFVSECFAILTSYPQLMNFWTPCFGILLPYFDFMFRVEGIKYVMSCLLFYLLIR